eukprot:3354110-Pleurochrysis_carterae.AAC.1
MSPASHDSSSMPPASSSDSSAPARCASPSPTNVCHSSFRSCSALSSTFKRLLCHRPALDATRRRRLLPAPAACRPVAARASLTCPSSADSARPLPSVCPPPIRQASLHHLTLAGQSMGKRSRCCLPSRAVGSRWGCRATLDAQCPACPAPLLLQPSRLSEIKSTGFCLIVFKSIGRDPCARPASFTARDSAASAAPAWLFVKTCCAGAGDDIVRSARECRVATRPKICIGADS